MDGSSRSMPQPRQSWQGTCSGSHFLDVKGWVSNVSPCRMRSHELARKHGTYWNLLRTPRML